MAGRQPGRHIGRKAGIVAGRQAYWQAGRQAGRQAYWHLCPDLEAIKEFWKLKNSYSDENRISFNIQAVVCD